MTELVSLTIAVASSGEAVSISTLVDKLIPSTHMWLLYVSSLATDRPGLSVGRPVGAQAYFVSGFYYMVGLRLCDTLSVSEDDVASGVQGVVPLPIVFGTNSCIFYKGGLLKSMLFSKSRIHVPINGLI